MPSDTPTRQSICPNIWTELGDSSGRYLLVRAGATVTADITPDGSIRVSGPPGGLGAITDVLLSMADPATGNPFTEHTA